MNNAPKPFAKYLGDKTCKIKQMQSISVTLRTYINQVNFSLEKLNPKEDSSKTTISKVLSKIPKPIPILKTYHHTLFPKFPKLF